jgi:zinc transport system ATP-binding protein
VYETEKVQIICKKLTVGYEKDIVVENLDFTVCSGDYISVIGENGTGKSTLLKVLLGLLTPKSGSITFGKDLKKNNIGYLSQQNPLQKDFPASVYEVVLSGCLNRKGMHPFYSAKDKELAKKNIEKLGITQLTHQSFADLSGGQKQRVLLARALCATDKIMFLDEPITGLDPLAMREMYDLIWKLNQDMQITIVMVTHDIENALKYSNKILCLRKQDYFFGTKDEFLDSEFGKDVKS